MAGERSLRLRVITPDRVFYEGEVEMVEFNTTEGEIGILPGHIPMTVIVKPGILNIYEESGTREAALHSGFTEILQNEVTILAEVVEWPDEIDARRAEAARVRAQERIHSSNSETDILRAETALQRAIARMSVIK